MKKIEELEEGYNLCLGRGDTYHLRWRDLDGRWRSKKLDGTTLAQAKSHAAEIMMQLVDPHLMIDPESGDDPTFGEIWLSYERKQQQKLAAGDLSDGRWELILLRRDRYFRPMLFAVRCSKLGAALGKLDRSLREGFRSPPQVDPKTGKKKRKSPSDGKPLSPNTIDDIIKTARACWKLAHATGRTRFGPDPDYRTPGFQHPLSRKPKGRYGRFEEFGGLLNTTSRGHIQDLFLLEFGCGVRTGAIAELRVPQIHFDLGVINFDPLGDPETNKRKPIVAITGPMWRVLTRLIENAHPDGWLFHYRGKPIATNKLGEKTKTGRLRRPNYYQQIKRIADRAGIESDDGSAFNRYSIRRSLIDFVDSHLSSSDVSFLAGHYKLPKVDQRKIFEVGSTTTNIYKRRQLAPAYRAGHVIERCWWPSIAPFCDLKLEPSAPPEHLQRMQEEYEHMWPDGIKEVE